MHKIRVSGSRSATNNVQIYGIWYTIYNTPQNLVDLSSETLTKVCILASYFWGFERGSSSIRKKNVFIGFQKSNLIVLLIFSLLLLQYEIYSVCNAIVIIFLIEKQFFKSILCNLILIFSSQKLYFSSIYFFVTFFVARKKCRNYFFAKTGQAVNWLKYIID